MLVLTMVNWAGSRSGAELFLNSARLVFLWWTSTVDQLLVGGHREVIFLKQLV